MRLGGCDASAGGLIHIKDQKFGNTKEASTIFTGSNFEAIVGLAYPELAEKDVTPMFDNMMEQKLLVSNIFAFHMLEVEEEGKHGKPELTLGFYDKSKFVGDLDWHNVELKYMYGIKLDDIKINGKALNVCSKLDGKPCMVTMDSGSTANGVPTKALSAFTDAKMPVSTNFVECEDRNSIGSLTYVINGKDYTLNADEWLYQKDVNFAQDTTIEFGNGPLGPQMLVQLESVAKPVEDTSNIQIATIMPSENAQSTKNADNSEPTK